MRKAKIRKPKERQRKSYRPNAKVEFYKCTINSQEGGGDEYTVSTVHFYFTHKGKKHDLYADVKHAIGSSVEESAYEVAPPAGYEGPFNHKAFSDEVVTYLSLIIPFSKHKRDGEKFAISFPVGMVVEFDIEGPDSE